MKGYYQEHLEAVAERNRTLFEEDRQRFENRMFWLGWKNNEIKEMIKYLKRSGKNEKENKSIDG